MKSLSYAGSFNFIFSFCFILTFNFSVYQIKRMQNIKRGRSDERRFLVNALRKYSKLSSRLNEGNDIEDLPHTTRILFSSMLFPVWIGFRFLLFIREPCYNLRQSDMYGFGIIRILLLWKGPKDFIFYLFLIYFTVVIFGTKGLMKNLKYLFRTSL